jgi:hypothetical protein
MPIFLFTIQEYGLLPICSRSYRLPSTVGNSRISWGIYHANDSAIVVYYNMKKVTINHYVSRGLKLKLLTQWRLGTIVLVDAKYALDYRLKASFAI